MEGHNEQRGHGFLIALFTAFYWLGAAQIRWPQQFAFFGSRWRYREEPELSDAGLFCVQAGGVIVMLASVWLLFLPLTGPIG